MRNNLASWFVLIFLYIQGRRQLCVCLSWQRRTKWKLIARFNVAEIKTAWFDVFDVFMKWLSDNTLHLKKKVVKLIMSFVPSQVKYTVTLTTLLPD